jgi:hypothetical protein
VNREFYRPDNAGHVVKLIEFRDGEIFVYVETNTSKICRPSISPLTWRGERDAGRLRPPPEKPELDEILSGFPLRN